jgi:cell division protein FtsW (lipid II flippase)
MAVVTPGTTTRTGRNLEAILTGCAVALSIFAYALVGLAVDGSLPPGMIGFGAGFGGLALGLHLVVRRFARYADPTLLPIATIINGIGLVMIHRLDLEEGRSFGDSLAVRQLTWTMLGVVSAAVIVYILKDHRVLQRFTYRAMAAGLVLLLLPLTPGLGRNLNGARIWIGIGPLSFQPGELAKIALTIFFAGYLVTARDSLSLVGRKVLGLQFPRARDLGPIITAWVVCLGVLVFERDLGTSLLFFGLFVGLLYVATERLSWAVLGFLLFVGGAFMAWTTFSHVQRRVDLWLHPFAADTLPISTQIVQGLFGMADGGLLGTGLGQGRPGSVFAAESDMILASLGEELGLTGVFALLVLYALIVERGLRTAIGVRDGFGKLLAGGLAFSMALQCFVVMGGVTRVIPLTGLTLPFLAYGGSSLLANWMIIGLLLRISDSARRPGPDTTSAPIIDVDPSLLDPDTGTDLEPVPAGPRLPPAPAGGDQETVVVRP